MEAGTGDSCRNSCRGFVLTGGRSSRMGRDKALLPMGDSTLVERIAAQVRAAAGNVTLIGAPERYEGLGIPVAADLRADCGPLGGVYTALALTDSPWNLIVACDMPGLTGDFLAALLRAAVHCGSDCLVPQTPGGLHPLCAVYHRRTLAAVKQALTTKSLKMHDLVKGLQAEIWPVEEAALLENVNTPMEWGVR